MIEREEHECELTIEAGNDYVQYSMDGDNADILRVLASVVDLVICETTEEGREIEVLERLCSEVKETLRAELEFRMKEKRKDDRERKI